MTETANDLNDQTLDHGDGEAAKDIPVIREQTRESLQILRNLLLLLMPKEEEGGPKLVDLLAALIAQQRDILTGIARLQSDMNALFDRMDGTRGEDTQHAVSG